MTDAVIPVHLSGSLLEHVSQDADRSGMSVESWLIALAEERMRDRQVTERFFAHAPKDLDGKRFLEILNSTKDNPPLPGDELED
jgi:hypothetical protein